MSEEIWAHVTHKPSLIPLLYGILESLRLYSMELSINCINQKAGKNSMEANCILLCYFSSQLSVPVHFVKLFTHSRGRSIKVPQRTYEHKKWLMTRLNRHTWVILKCWGIRRVTTFLYIQILKLYLLVSVASHLAFWILLIFFLVFNYFF